MLTSKVSHENIFGRHYTMEWKDQHKLLVPYDEKQISFRTSTPYVENLQRNEKELYSIKACSTLTNDSGMGASLSDSYADSVKSKSDNVTVLKTPRKCKMSQYDRVDYFRCSPVSSHKTFNKYNSHQGADSGFSFYKESELDINKVFQSGRKSGYSRRAALSLDIKGVARKLDLDMDIYDNKDKIKSEHFFDTPFLVSNSTQSVPFSKCMDDVLQKYSPVASDRLIGRIMGRDKVDILLELECRGIGAIVSAIILSLLEPCDLCRMCAVSKDWKRICLSDKAAKQRRRHFLKQHRDNYRKLGKENAGKMILTSRSGPGPLQNLHMLNGPPPDVHIRTNAEQFQEAADSLIIEEKLQKCPLCRKPAKVLPIQDRGKCQDPDCGYDYCSRCLSAFHNSTDCAPILTRQTKTVGIGTKKSKRNLRRL